MKRIMALLITISLGAQAHNNLFFPGDSYFSTALDQKFTSTLKDSNKLTMTYHRYANSFMLCGYAGMESLQIDKLPKKTKENLKHTLDELFKKESEKARVDKYDETKTKHFPVLIYNKDFDFKKFPVALKFNENFKEVQLKKAKRAHVVDDRVNSKELRTLDDTHAEAIPALNTTHIPEDLSAQMGVKEAARIAGNKIVFVILLGGTAEDLKDHAEKQEGLEIIIVGKSVKRIKYANTAK